MTEKRFKAEITLRRDGKVVHRFTAPDDSALDAVRWVTDRSLADAQWADAKAAETPRYDERIVPGSRVHWSPKGSENGWEGVVKAVNPGTLRARVRLDTDKRDVSIMLKNLEHIPSKELRLEGEQS